MVPIAHIAGVPVEETALSLAPVATIFGSVALIRLRQVRRRVPSFHHQRELAPQRPGRVSDR
jgi:hypothetical protein